MWILSVAIDSKYNVRRCDVLVQNSTPCLNLFRHLIEYFFKKWTWAIGKNLPCDTRARSLHYRFYRFNLVWPPCNVVDDLCQILGMFSLNSIGCVTVRSHKYSGGKYITDVCILTLKSSYRKIWSNILTARAEQAHGATKWIKNNLLMIPPWIWLCKKYA